MKKTWIEYLAEKGLGVADLATKTAGELAALHQDYSDQKIKSIEDSIGEKVSKSELTTAQETIKAVKEELIVAQAEIKAMKETGKSQDVKGGLSVFKDAYERNKEGITGATIKGRSHELTINKADTLRASVVDNTTALRLQDIGQLAHRKLTAYDLFPKFSIPANSNGTVRYIDWDAATTVRAAAAIAEGGTFPESTAKWAEYTVSIQKVGDKIPVSEEILYDGQVFANELGSFLETNVAIKVDDRLVNGTGVAPDISGIKAQVPTYVPVAAGIPSASIYDLIVKLRESITAPYGAKYNVNVALMNISDISDMKLEKDANLNYILPPFYNQNGQIVDGVTVIECNSFAPDTMAIGDSRYGRIYEDGNIYVELGRGTGDFESDMMSMKARKRLNLLIRNVDRTGWLQVTSISAALAILSTP